VDERGRCDIGNPITTWQSRSPVRTSAPPFLQPLITLPPPLRLSPRSLLLRRHPLGDIAPCQRQQLSRDTQIYELTRHPVLRGPCKRKLPPAGALTPRSQGAPAFDTAVPVLSQLLKADLVEYGVFNNRLSIELPIHLWFSHLQITSAQARQMVDL